MIAQSCPPINYPEPNYYIRGMQQDPMPKSILKDEIKMSKMTQSGVKYNINRRKWTLYYNTFN